MGKNTKIRETKVSRVSEKIVRKSRKSLVKNMKEPMKERCYATRCFLKRNCGKCEIFAPICVRGKKWVKKGYF